MEQFLALPNIITRRQQESTPPEHFRNTGYFDVTLFL